MSQPAVAALAPLPFDFELVFDDGEPVESPWHYKQMHMLSKLLERAAAEQQRSDVYVGGNQFVYYSVEQARTVAEGRQLEFRGPDVFWIGGVDPRKEREGWVVWEEDGRYPDVIFEFLSKSNKASHRRKKKDLYARVFRTPEYFLFGPKSWKLEGFRLVGGEYRPITPDAHGRLWSEQISGLVGLWHGVESGQEADWIRLYRPDGSLVPTAEEAEEAERQRAEAERQRAEAERQRAETERQRAETADLRAEAAEAELARLRALLDERTRG